MGERKRVPSTWKWVKLGDVCDTTSGGTPSRKEPKYYGGSIHWVKSGELEYNTIVDTEEKITEEAIRTSSAKIFPKGTLLIALYGATIGKLAFLGVAAATNQAICGIYENKHIDSKLLFNYLFFKKQHLVKKSIGGAQPNISQSILRDLPLPLPPLPEQYRIVAKIEELFSELDKGVEALKTAQQQLKVYRQAVLKWAFEGKLTEEWRKQQKNLPTAAQLLEQIQDEREKQAKATGKKSKPLNPLTDEELAGLPDLPKHWLWIRFGEIVENFKRGPFGSAIKKEFFVPSGHKVYEQKNAIYKSEHLGNYYINEIKFDELSAFEVIEGDYIVSCSGTIGKLFRLPEKSPRGVINQALLRIRIYDKLLSHKYFSNIFESLIFQKRIIDDAKGSAMQNLAGVKEMALVPFSICSTSEQNQIVQEIESRLSVADKIEESIGQSLKQAEALRQSILKKAFEGKLVPQDTNDEPAEKLLARIRAEKGTQMPVKGRRKGRQAAIIAT
jgi:type I restriction enzyme S subunit